jgi:hypothetical protein
MDIESKKCNKCGEIYPITDFYRTNNICRTCKNLQRMLGKRKHKHTNYLEEKRIKEEREKSTGLRVCKQCGIEKPLDDFNRNTPPTRREHTCKECSTIKKYIKELQEIEHRKEREKQTGLRVCNICKLEKPLSEFYLKLNRQRIKVPSYFCIECYKIKLSEERKEDYANDPEKYKSRRKIYYRNNTEEILEKSKISYIENQEDRLLYVKEYRKTHKEEIKKRAKQRRLDNPEKFKEKDKRYHSKPEVKEKTNKRHRERFRTDINFRLGLTLRNRMNNILRYSGRRIRKSAHTMDLIGCSIEFLKEHLQQTAIKNGYLTFDINNYRGNEFHLDHIIPCAGFRLECSYHQRLCFHWSNLQILEGSENLSKNDDIDFSLVDEFKK